MSRAMAILVTGAAGRIGRAAVRELVERGYHVRALDVVRAGGTDDVLVGSITDPAARAAGRRGNRRPYPPGGDTR